MFVFAAWTLAIWNLRQCGHIGNTFAFRIWDAQFEFIVRLTVHLIDMLMFMLIIVIIIIYYRSNIQVFVVWLFSIITTIIRYVWYIKYYGKIINAATWSFEVRSISEISSFLFWPRPWHIEIRHRVKKTSTITFFGFETLKSKIRRLKLWKPTVLRREGDGRAAIIRYMLLFDIITIITTIIIIITIITTIVRYFWYMLFYYYYYTIIWLVLRREGDGRAAGACVGARAAGLALPRGAHRILCESCCSSEYTLITCREALSPKLILGIGVSKYTRTFSNIHLTCAFQT